MADFGDSSSCSWKSSAFFTTEPLQRSAVMHKKAAMKIKIAFIVLFAVRNSKVHEQQQGIELVRKGVCLASLSSTSFELIYLTSYFLNIQKRLVFLGHFETYQRKRRGIHGEKRTGFNAFQGRLRFGKFILAVLLYRILHYANFKFSFLKTKLKLSG